MSRSSSLNRNNLTVTSPIGVDPIMRAPSVAKCSSHRSDRGLKRRMNSPEAECFDPMSVPFARLHRAHESARFDKSPVPPCFRLTMWSTSQPVSRSDSRIRQYSQQPLARDLISFFNQRLMPSAMTASQSLGFRHYDQMIEPQIIVQLCFFLRKQTGFLLFGNESPNTLTGFFRCLEIGQCLRWNLLD